MKNIPIILFWLSFELGAAEPTPIWTSPGQYPFTAPGCDFGVSFPAKPQTGSYKSDEQNYQCTTHFALIQSVNGLGGMKAECTVCTVQRSTPLTETEVIPFLREHAKTSGVEDIVYSFDQTELGTVASYRGVMKSIGNTFVSIWIWGEKSGMSLTGSAPYQQYPEIGFDQFVQTIYKTD